MHEAFNYACFMIWPFDLVILFDNYDRYFLNLKFGEKVMDFWPFLILNFF